ncbi:MAG: M14 family metallopeptidase [Cyclobacteriaceae bacterium]|nr:M14 family metallopeptidase [Cyclobacteriaceae bacterium]
MRNNIVVIFCSFLFSTAIAQELLPPPIPWKGKSEKLIADDKNNWITPTEQNQFKQTPGYEETVNWLQDLCGQSDLLAMVSIGKSLENRDIWMVVASTSPDKTVKGIEESKKPSVLIQAGIHAGEIDGKDAGMMLLRDIAFGKKRSLINSVNLLFIPILNVDGHERTSAYNRPNQRGPENMGWRTNSKNLNLNRDYSKLETRGIQSVVKVINEFEPVLYIDVHVTDGADYQYDVTYGSINRGGYSPHISAWLSKSFNPQMNEELEKMGHVPGPLLLSKNDKDFSEGNIDFFFDPGFSHSYGDVRHLPTILVENHSLKDFRRRVLGTYVFMEKALKLVAEERAVLIDNIQKDKGNVNSEVVLSWKFTKDSTGNFIPSNSFLLKGISTDYKKSMVTNQEYVNWTGNKEDIVVFNYKNNVPDITVKKPLAYWIPAAWTDVITILEMHGVEMEVIESPSVKLVNISKIEEYSFQGRPFEGHIKVIPKAIVDREMEEVYQKGSVRISTQQPLGDLVVLLLEPQSSQSFFQWGYFNTIFSRTEYIESYVLEPYIEKILKEDAELKTKFEEFKSGNTGLTPRAIMSWFYSQSPYYDSRYLLYPVGREY